jgi:YqaJ-like viral recombinase domain
MTSPSNLHLVDAPTALPQVPPHVLTMPQRSRAWREARIGRLTSSRAPAMCATIKSGEAAARRNLRTELVLERLTGRSHETRFISADMQAGIDREPDAIAAYEAATGQGVTRIGFVAHGTLWAGCSPDALVDDGAGVLEVKCGKSATHLEFLRSGDVPREHLIQLTHQLWITGAAWAEYVSFDDRFPPPLQLGLVRFTREELDLHLYELNVRAFLAEIDRELEAVSALARERIAV